VTRAWLIGLSLGALTCLLLSCLIGAVYPFDFLVNLVAGWAFYAARVLPQVRPSATGILTALVCLGGLAWGSHVFLRWLSAQAQAAKPAEEEGSRPWPARRTLALVTLVVLMFVAGIAVVGVAHQTAWLVTSPEPLVEGSIRKLAARTQSRNNLKQIALTMHSYFDANGSLPPAAIWDKQGRPLLSWRVLLLPYLEADNVYKKFHLDEPWDSPWNIRLLAEIPAIYIPLGENDDANGFRTRWLVFTGRGTAFEGKSGLNLKTDFPNGRANTFLIVESARAVPWTKPEDLPYSPDMPLPPLGNLIPDYFLSALADGSVLNVERTTSEATIRARITRNGPPP
jgi:Protein of unknown function (DUF1559)